MTKAPIKIVTFKTRTRKYHLGFSILSETELVVNQPPNNYTGWNLRNAWSFTDDKFLASIEKFVQLTGLKNET